MTRDKDSDWGKEAERIAFEYLIKEGYVVRERNWRPGHSSLEIDLIAELPGTMVFVEVKARTRGGGDAAEAVDLTKQRHVARAADKYLRGLDSYFEYRFDIIAVTGDRTDYDLEHFKDAFLPPLG